MWFEIEDGRMLNSDLITDVFFREHGTQAKTAIPYVAGIALSGESRAVYDYFKSIQTGDHFYRPPVEPTIIPDKDPQTSTNPQPGQE